MSVLVLGIDAGGTSIRIRCADERGDLVLDLEGAASADLGPDGLKNLLSQREIARQDVRNVYAGVAGLSRHGMQARWASELGDLFPQATVNLVPDYLIAFYGAIAEFGILVIAGTGSVIYGETQGKKCRIGGRGWEWGDWGSGSWITSEVLRFTFNALDGVSERTKLVNDVCTELGTDDPGELGNAARQLCQSKGRGFLVPLVSSSAKAGDRDALEVFYVAAFWLCQQVESAARQLGFDHTQKFPVAVTGGLWECGGIILNPFSEHLKLNFPNACITLPHASPIDGAVRQALLKLNDKNN